MLYRRLLPDAMLAVLLTASPLVRVVNNTLFIITRRKPKRLDVGDKPVERALSSSLAVTDTSLAVSRRARTYVSSPLANMLAPA